MGMKMAKASTADLDMAMELSNFLDDLDRGYLPAQAQSEDAKASDSIACLDADDGSQCSRVVAELRKILNKGSISRVIFGMAVVCDPRNELLDPDVDTLEVHPKFAKLLAAKAPNQTTPA
ncbi:hypothetical protein [Rhodoferax sp.]|uniref:hypothetical protein n=1 Tax=Rhodoferax sp. TaxID=50421 RepID=UPI002ACE72F7|nr:hypothetical protein [Rhodoferax sp.]MDZ7920661.1 hypothetical protein [Rhodoferax sp.]